MNVLPSCDLVPNNLEIHVKPKYFVNTVLNIVWIRDWNIVDVIVSSGFSCARREEMSFEIKLVEFCKAQPKD